MIKTKFVPTVVAILVVVAAAYILFPNYTRTTEGQEKREIILNVSFTPDNRYDCRAEGPWLTERVTIHARVGAIQWPVARECDSPWVRTTYASPGEVVEIRAEQYAGHDLVCTITQLGWEPATDRAYGPSRIKCRWVVRV